MAQEPIKSKEDVGLKIVFKDFDKGDVKVLLNVSGHIKILIFFATRFSEGGKDLICGGSENI